MSCRHRCARNPSLRSPHSVSFPPRDGVELKALTKSSDCQVSGSGFHVASLLQQTKHRATGTALQACRRRGTAMGFHEFGVDGRAFWWLLTWMGWRCMLLLTDTQVARPILCGPAAFRPPSVLVLSFLLSRAQKAGKRTAVMAPIAKFAATDSPRSHARTSHFPGQ